MCPAARKSCGSHFSFVSLHTGLYAILNASATANLYLLKTGGNFGFTFTGRAQHDSSQASKINQGLILFVRRGLFRVDNCAKALLLLVSQAQSQVGGSRGGD